jgi:hypothetical protein
VNSVKTRTQSEVCAIVHDKRQVIAKNALQLARVKEYLARTAYLVAVLENAASR